jgi:hypothetical protein
MVKNLIKLFAIFQLYAFSMLIAPNFAFAQNPSSIPNSNFGPFTSNFEIPSGWKSEDGSVAKAKNLFANDGIQSDINLVMSAPRDGVLIVSWQFFDAPMAFPAGQLIADIPTFEFVKKSDTKVFPGTTNNANRFEYALTRATGASNDNLTFSSKGKSRLVAYWVNLPIQLKNAKGELLSGMLSVFFRGSETEAKKNKVDSVISAFMDSLNLETGFTQISYEKYKDELTKEKLKKELMSEMAKNSDKETLSDNTSKPTPSPSTPMIVDFYMVDKDGNCYRFEDKNSFKKITCPVHKSK